MSKITFDKHFSLLYDFIAQRRNGVIGLIILLTAVSAVGISFIKFENDIKFMLPADSSVRRSIDFLNSSRISNNIVISMKLDSPELPLSKLTNAAKRLSSSIDSPLISRVKNIAGSLNMAEDANEIIEYAPQLFSESVLVQLKQQISSDQIKERCGQIYRQALMPGGSFMASAMFRDPFGISLGVLDAMKKLSLTLGYDAVLEDGVLLSRDRSHAMVIIETLVSVTDSFGSRRLISYIREKLSSLPDYISADIIAGHLHAIDNETILKRDIGVVSVAVLIAFFVVFICIFRDPGTLTIFLMPLASVLIAICLTYFIFRQVSYFIAGMAAVVTGIAIDYGIHVYTAVRISRGQPESVKRVAKPILIGALTTMGVFGGFLFSRVPGYRQLALFSICGISICLFYSLFILPLILRDKRSSSFESMSSVVGRIRSHMKKRTALYLWGVFITIATVLSFRVVFENDVKQFDGATKQTIEAEEEFHRVWGGKEKPAIFVVTGDSLEGAIATNENVYNEIKENAGDLEFASVATIWPSLKTRRSNLGLWKEFWNTSRRSEVEEFFGEHGTVYGFSDTAFSAFFNSLAHPGFVKDGNPMASGLFNHIVERFVNGGNGEHRVLSFFPDKEANVKLLKSIADRSEEMFIISRKVFSKELSRSISSEIIPLSIAAAIIITILTMLFLRDVRLTGIALSPVVSALAAIAGGLALTGTPLNASAAVAALIVCGLCIDYGIFMVYSCRDSNADEATTTAVVLSALTTLIGSGTLLFAKHPILFSIGRTITVGVLAGFLTSFFVVPISYALWIEGGTKEKV